jgi:hypothetical protein
MDRRNDKVIHFSFGQPVCILGVLMNYPEASFGVYEKTTHPFIPSLSREGKPEGRGELNPL